MLKISISICDSGYLIPANSPYLLNLYIYTCIFVFWLMNLLINSTVRMATISFCESNLLVCVSIAPRFILKSPTDTAQRKYRNCRGNVGIPEVYDHEFCPSDFWWCRVAGINRSKDRHLTLHFHFRAENSQTKPTVITLESREVRVLGVLGMWIHWYI